MISLRYHVVSIAACFLALAVGVVLGSTALNGTLLSGLAGEKKDEHEDRWKGFVRSERRYGAFRKVIPIPPGVDPDGVAADYDRGILTVHLPKSETRKPRPISITGPADEKKPSRGADR